MSIHLLGIYNIHIIKNGTLQILLLYSNNFTNTLKILIPAKFLNLQKNFQRNLRFFFIQYVLTEDIRVKIVNKKNT